MQAYVDWVLKSFGTQVIKKKQPVRPVFPDYLSVSYDYGKTSNTISTQTELITDFKLTESKKSEKSNTERERGKNENKNKIHRSKTIYIITQKC